MKTLCINKRIFTIIILGILCAGSMGCAVFKIHHFERVSKRPDEVKTFFDLLDKTVQTAHVQNTSDFSVLGFPYLRANRFWAELGKNLHDDSQRTLWIESLRRLDVHARIKEIRNLPDEDLQKLSAQLHQPAHLSSLQSAGGPPNREEIISRLQTYSKTFLEHDQSQDGFYETLETALKKIPREYSTFQRIVGVYPLFSIPVFLGTKQSHKKFSDWHNTPVEKLKTFGTVKNFSPSEFLFFYFDDLAEMFSSSRRNSLGIPQLTDEEMKKLIIAFAPLYSQDVAEDYDQFGEVVWKNGKVTVDTTKPAVYYFVSYAILKNQPAVQLNYVIWYTGRFGPNSPWIERGSLDGITVRITLDQNGLPLMLDTMNNCGCYHFFIPRRDKIKEIIPHPLTLAPFVPAWLPESYPEKNLHLRINSGWHQLQHISAGDTAEKTFNYQLLPYEVLESLPHDEDGRTESVFTPAGIMKNSQRIEPLIFFSMGIPRIGFMRERGHHAISMTGEAYFDDPRLFEKNFVFK